MGPPRERGGTLPCRARTPARSSRRFNGATARTRWNAQPARGPSPFPRWLQWGHRANAVERGRGAPGLRWSSGFNGATARTRWNATGPKHSRTRPKRFNGATARTRWNDISRVSRTRTLAASMGPPRERGGTATPGRDPGFRPCASMGPPRERGGTVSRRLLAPLQRKLQWGHRANAVERSRAETERCRRFAGRIASTSDFDDAEVPGEEGATCLARRKTGKYSKTCGVCERRRETARHRTARE